MPTAPILVVDRDPWVRRLLSVLLTSNNYSVLETDDGSEALGLIASNRPGLLIVDVAISGMEAAAFLTNVVERGYKGPIVVLSASTEAGAIAERFGATHMEKPFDPKDLLDAVTRLFPTTSNRIVRPVFVSFVFR